MSKISDIMNEINKKYCIDSISLSDGNGNIQDNIGWISTGCHSIDRVLGKGLAKGRIYEIMGIESSGKSTMALFFTKTVQGNGGKILWIDAEHSFSNEHATHIGVKLDDSFILYQPDNGEQALEIINSFVKDGAVDLVVVDSVAALTSKKEIENDFDKETMALQARMLGRGLRVLTANLSKNNTAIIFINQLRSSMSLYGPKQITPGGAALKYYASTRISVKKGDKILDDKKDVVGSIITIEAVKNKVAPPFRSATFPLYFMKGIDIDSLAFDDALEKDIITKNGNTYSYGDVKLGVGQEKSREFLKTNKELLSEIINKLKQ